METLCIMCGKEPNKEDTLREFRSTFYAPCAVTANIYAPKIPVRFYRLMLICLRHQRRHRQRQTRPHLFPNMALLHRETAVLRRYTRMARS